MLLKLGGTSPERQKFPSLHFQSSHKHIPSHVPMFPHDFAVSEGGLPKTGYIRLSSKNSEESTMRPLSPHSAIIANNLIDNGFADHGSPDQTIADTVNSHRTQRGQDALAQLAEMAPPARTQRALPADPTPYRTQEIRQHRLNRISTLLQSAPPPALSLSGEPAVEPMDFTDRPDTTPSASSAPAFQEVANQSELSMPLGEPVYSSAIARAPSSYSHGVGHYPAPSASSLAGVSTHAPVMPAPASTGEEPAVPGLPSQAPGSSTTRPTKKRQKVRDPQTGEIVSKNTLAGRQKVLDPQTGQLVSRNALASRKKVRDPETGEIVSRGTLAGRQKVRDPETGEIVSKSALAKCKKVLDPETGEIVSRGALAARQKVRDPETGEIVSKNTLAARQKVLDPETGELVSKNTLVSRKRVRDPETGEIVSKGALAGRQKRRLNHPGA
ncbi:hypothetical protein [Xanthomonas oryzae]|uniref:hypothetical protein n=1 Tax=Xanthomonas oryzae TaxID=347 RepID=UPI001EE817B7|nr:hypothetical protein [Xanthomonas oryzae]